MTHFSSHNDKAALAFVLLFLSSALWPILPHFSLIIVSLILAALMHYFSVSAAFKGALLGFAWAAIMGHTYTTWQLESRFFNQNVIIEGEIRSIHLHSASLTEQMRVDIELSKLGKYPSFFAPKVRLSWYRPTFVPKQGQQVRMLVNIKRPSSLANPNTFHYQTWLTSKNIVASGYIIDSPSNALLNDTRSLRQHSIDTLHELDLKNSKWLQALSFGYRGELAQSDWTLMQQSGTAHLFAISGLHLGIVFGYFMILLSKPVALLINFSARQMLIQKTVVLIGFALSVVYAHLAGNEIPVLRALIALAFWVYLVLTQSHWRLSAIFLYMLCSFFILFPYSILSISFYFSFIAVISIWVFMWRFAPSGKLSLLQKILLFIKLQVFLSAVTLPITLLVFGHLPVFSLLANVVLVPVVSLLLVPLCLFAAASILLSHAGLSFMPFQTLYAWADLIMGMSLQFMQWMSVQSEGIGPLDINMTHGVIFLCWLLVCLALMPFLKYRHAVLCVLISSLTLELSRRESDFVKLQVFDVGQGTAIALHKHTAHTDAANTSSIWLFDTGASFPTGFSMAEAVLLPYLRHYRIDTVDAIFVSHFDNDHSGGLSILRQNLKLKDLVSPQHACLAGREFFMSKDIYVKVLWPLEASTASTNANSCVIKLYIYEHTVLIAGDIERDSEQAILAYYQAKPADAGINLLKADILIAPHHGSKTSSTLAFVQAVSPAHTVFTAAHDNRWGFPHEDVEQRYQAIGSATYQTGSLGAIEFSFVQQKHAPSADAEFATRLEIKSYRQDYYRRWYFASPKE